MSFSSTFTKYNISRETNWGTAVNAAYNLPAINDVSVGPQPASAIRPGFVRDGSNTLTEYNTDAGNFYIAFSGLQIPCTPRITRWLFANFLMDTTTVGATTKLAHSLLYTTSEVGGSGDSPAGTAYTLHKYMGSGTTDSIAVAGMVLTRIRLDMPQLGSAMYTVDGIGKSEAAPAGVTSSPTLLTDTVLCTKDMKFYWDGTERTHMSGYIEFRNNAKPQWKKATSPVAMKLGQLEVTGEMTMDWGDMIAHLAADVRSGAATKVKWAWGSFNDPIDTDGDLRLALDCRVIPDATQADMDGMERLTFRWEGAEKSASGENWEMQTVTTEAFDFAT